MKKLKITLTIFSIVLILFGIGFYISSKEETFKTYKTNIKNLTALNNLDASYVYLSDIQYDKNLSKAKDGYEIHLDKNNRSGLITLNIDNIKTPFIKGISAWASSTLVYDLTNYQNFDYFTSYIGVDAGETDTYANNGAKFTIYTSEDSKNWQVAKDADGNNATSNTFYAWSNASFIKIPIKGHKFLKLEAYENGNTWWSHWDDDTVYANAKLIKEDYVEDSQVFDLVKTVDTYDKEIKKYENDIKIGNFTNLDQYRLTILQRKFVNNVTYEILQALMNYDEEYVETLTWLMNDEKILKEYVMGGTPDGNYAQSLKILRKFYTNPEFKKDLDNDLYRRMMISLSLTHSANVGLWVSGAPDDPNDPNGSDALKRYNIFKKLYNDETKHFERKIFESLSVEEMRFVMNNIIDDEEIEWINNYATINNSTDPYSYVNYTTEYNYNLEKYYDPEQITYWNAKRHNNKLLSYNFNDYNITYKKGYPKLWIVFEEGGVCGALSKTGSNIWGSYGVPSTVVSQPGHAAYFYMTMNAEGVKSWELGNDVYGWDESGKTEKLSIRMPNGWGSGSYAGKYPATYILLAQAALNDYDNYEKAEEILSIADIYKDNRVILKTIIESALKIQNINFDAWYLLVNSYLERNANESELYNLAKRIAENLKYFPLPMYDLIRLIEPNMTSNNAKAAIQDLVKDTLNEVVKSPDTVYQAGAVRQVAQYLLNNNDFTVATFSFSGENAQKIILSDRFEDTNITWQYSLDGGGNWSSNIQTKTHKLTNEELEKISEETDIIIRLVGALDVYYDIAIEKATMPPLLYNNDYENRIIGATEDMDWRFSETEKWTSYKDSEPDLSGNKTIEIRMGYHDNYLPSEYVTLNFKENKDTETDYYIPLSRITLKDYSSDEPGQNNAAQNAIDGNINTFWHTVWNHQPEGTPKYITLSLDHITYLSSIEYYSRQDGGTNGIASSLTIYISLDGEKWTEVKTEKFNPNKQSKKITFEPVLANYVKIVGEGENDHLTASMINLYEDLTKITYPTAEIKYSIEKPTNKDVVATLTNFTNIKNIENIEITNMEGIEIIDGNYTHTFTHNDEFTFEYIDKTTKEKGSTTARVTWIDKEPPQAKIEYSTKSKTVTATLISDEDIIILNNDGNNNYVFFENGEFTFEYQDIAGNITKTTASVNWIVNEDNNKMNRSNSPDNIINKLESSNNINNNTDKISNNSNSSNTKAEYYNSNENDLNKEDNTSAITNDKIIEENKLANSSNNENINKTKENTNKKETKYIPIITITSLCLIAGITITIVKLKK